MQDSTIDSIPIYLGTKMSGAIQLAFGAVPSAITCRMVSDLPDQQIEALPVSDRIKRDLRKLRDYTRLFREETERALSRLQIMERDFLTCPLTIDPVKDPVLSPCCGHVFEREAVHQARWNQPPDSGGYRHRFVCPLCRVERCFGEWERSLPADNVIKRMRDYINDI